ncbi:MAG: SUMF1/EgtB/PvdO family nonheme iron enzyme [Coleofasciculaceae cyanobacterium RL_1_1]|nr:SUMF1/EgtB/PvdO family nonheme iron enzyme [Coleofasciculaceae cyanobacterium RL_1_1]
MLWQPGLVLNDTYRIDRQFDGGGFGILYQATDLRQKRTVAIKTLNPTRIASDRFQQEQIKFINEAMKLAKFQHRHIVEVFEVVESGGVLGMVMEFVQGDNLAECLQQRGQPFKELIALRYIQQVGEALALLHDRQMLHRDVKPLNIMRRSANQNEVVLIDFGLARELEFGVTQTFTNAGTPAYAAPEQFRRGREGQVKPGAYTDVYGLAATLYALLTAQNPFPAEFRLLGVPLTEPRQHNGSISDRVSRAIVRGMAIEIRERSATVAEFLSDLGLGRSGGGQPPPKVVTPARPVSVGLGLSRFRAETVQVDQRGKIVKRQIIEPEYFTERVNGIGIEMVAIPGGRFWMGSPDGEESRSDNESPQHEVSVSDFFLGKFTVTQAQWRAVAQLPQINQSLNADPSRFKGDNRPVERVSWDDAQEFCTRLSQATGKAYRLPSEAQWEYACRAGTTTPFAFGATLNTDIANYDGNYTYGNGKKGVYREQTIDVGSFPPNAWGLYDMHGNVYEWCEDSWHNNYNGAPTDGTAWIDNGTEYKLLRGGSWINYPRNCRSASRSNTARDFRDFNIGFRVVLPRT